MIIVDILCYFQYTEPDHEIIFEIYLVPNLRQ